MDLDRVLAQVDQAEEEIVQFCQSLIRLETVNTGQMPTGNETLASQFISQYLKESGVEEIHILGRHPDRANLIARLGPLSSTPALLLLGHTDVVPVGDFSQWNHPPFGGEIVGGRLYGRGSADMKGAVAAEVMALVLIRRNNVPLHRSVTLAVVADEEAGGAYGMGWLVQEYPSLLQADFCINEGGGSSFEWMGQVFSILGLGEKGRYEVHLEVCGKGAHASQPWLGENAFYSLAQVLHRIQSFQPTLRRNHPFFPAVARVLDLPLPEEENPEKIEAFIEEVQQIHPLLGNLCRGLSRTTIVPSLIEGGIKSNSVPDRARLVCDVRTLPGNEREYVEQVIREITQGLEGVCFEVQATANPSASPLEEIPIPLLEKGLKMALGQEVEVLPGMTTGFTDSRFIRAIGVPAYGFFPSHPRWAGESRNIHGPDEWIPLEDLKLMTRFLIALIYHLCGL